MSNIQGFFVTPFESVSVGLINETSIKLSQQQRISSSYHESSLRDCALSHSSIMNSFTLKQKTPSTPPLPLSTTSLSGEDLNSIHTLSIHPSNSLLTININHNLYVNNNATNSSGTSFMERAKKRLQEKKKKELDKKSLSPLCSPFSLSPLYSLLSSPASPAFS